MRGGGKRRGEVPVKAKPEEPPEVTNFIRNIIKQDLSSGKHESIVTRFPPEPKGLQVLEKKGLYTFYEDNQTYGTPLVEGGACAYLTYNELGIAMCGIEKAYYDGVIDYKKPISCHLYPIRVEKDEHTDFQALNYDRWDICSAACTKGKEQQVYVYEFAKAAIIRKYGEDFYEELDAAAQYLREKDD